MLKASLRKDKLMAIDTLSYLDDAVMQVTEQGIRFYGKDKASVMISDLSMGKTAFSSYTLNPAEFSATFDVSSFIDVVKRISADVVNLEIDKNIRIFAVDKDREQDFLLPLLSDTAEKLQLNLTFKKAIEFDSDDLKSTIKDMSLISDVFKIGVNEQDDVILFCKDSSGKAVKVSVKPSKKGLEKYEKSSEKVFSSYANEYIDNALKGSKISSKVNVFLNDNYPVKLQFIEGSVELNTIVAPRVVDEGIVEQKQKQEEKK
jgi:hypothetical protein